MATATTNTAPSKTAPMTEKASEALHHAVDSISEKAAGGEEKIRQTVSHSAESIANQQKVVQEKWESSKVRQFAVENPLATAGIAFVAGALLTSLFRRS